MIKSRTKYEATEEEIKSLFKDYGVGKVIKTRPLGDGEFNAAFMVTCDNGNDYVLKIAPPKGARVLTYEKNMMDSEVYWYGKMKENTDTVDARDMYDMAFAVME